jgi:hypothetical protein
VLALVRRARRRILHNLLFYEGSNAASAALVAFTLLLILGTQVLAWYWAVLLPGAAALYAVWRVRKRLPNLYATAQVVDRRMQLADTLSTAVYFAGNDARGPAELRRFQLADAERVAGGVEPRRAIPYALPRSAYLTGVMLLVASSLFALRYGLTDHLDLKQPLARLVRDSLGLAQPDQQASLDRNRSPKDPTDDPLAGEQGPPVDSADASEQPNDSAESEPEQTPKNAAKAEGKNKGNQADSDSDQDGQADQSEQPAQGQQQNAANKNGDKEAKESQNGNSQSQSNQSLLGKMKEAMQNLLSSMQQNSRDQQQSASNQNSKSGKGQQNQAKQHTKGEKSKSQSDSQDQQSADEGQEAQNSPGQSADQQDSPLANKQPGSGAGNRDGAKDIHQAEQLAAMGKISEIIGKRAANVTGEATVDVQNTSQQLRTGYQDKRADHAQTGAEIHRDEIPVALESYVEQYFEQVRKQAATAKK